MKNVKLFADDNNLFISGVDFNTLNQKCNYCTDTLNQWFIGNRLHVNVDKTNIMIFPKTKANGICVKLSDITITKVQYCQYLGIFLDDTLTWSQHIGTVYSKLMKYFGMFYFTLHLCICIFSMALKYMLIPAVYIFKKINTTE